MDPEHTSPSRALRPLRRTDKIIVREVGDELVAYALDTEQVTALDPATAKVWSRLDGDTTIDEIAGASELTTADVETAVMRLDQAGLIAGGFDRRKFMRLAAAGAGAGALLAITAPAAMAAGSNRAITSLLASNCAKGQQGSSSNYRLTVNGLISGTGFPASGTANTITLQITVPTTTLSFSGSVTVSPSGGSFTNTPWSVTSGNLTLAEANSAVGKTFRVVATSTDSTSGTVTVTRTANSTSNCA